MNEGDSAGGGHQGLNPAPPAVTDRRSATTLNNNSNQRLYSQTLQSGSLVSGPAVILSRSAPLLQSTEAQSEQQRIANYSHQQKSQNTRVIITQVNPQNLSQQTSGEAISTRVPTKNLFGVNTTTAIPSRPKLTTSSSNLAVCISSTTASNLQSLATHTDFDQLSAARKRFRGEGSEGSSTPKAQSTNDNISALKKRILEYKYSRLRSVKEKYSEHVAELFFLQTGGSMMDYPTWKKKPPTQQFISFTNSYRLDGPVSDDVSKQHIKGVPSCTLEHILPQGAEIKIPSVGATPVAVSTTLPAAVVQLTQQGHQPGRPQGGRHGMVFGQIPATSAIGNPSTTPLVPGGTPILPDVHGTITEKQCLATARVLGNLPIQNSCGNNSQEQFSVKAKQEVYVMQRISELQREGLWTEKRLPKLQEPSRPKAHWDYLLEEMVWLAADFAQERKWKKSAAKKCARMVQKYFQERASAAQKAEKAQELHLKRVAAFIAKEVKMFWSNVEKFVEYKHHTKLEEKRKRALDQHLSFIVDQTEKFSQQLAEGMNKPTAGTSAAPSINSSRISSPKHKNFSDDEFCPANEMSEDDEETIAKAEAEAADVSEEVAALQRESEMQLEDFLKELPKDYLENRDKIVFDLNLEDSSDDEFKANENSSDDEDTIKEQEIAEKNVDHKKELEELNAENEMTLDELLAKYKASEKKESKVHPMETEDSYDSEGTEDTDSDATIQDSDDTSDNESFLSASDSEGENNAGLKSLLLEEEGVHRSEADKDNLINDAAAIAESIQPKGNTLSSTNVVTPVPFLLKHTLREYQHIGLDWLVTMHDRKLNGILADEMGLGKTIQTIALLAHLACVKANWGPHLIVVPSSVMLNWEMEFKKWCPGFKILTYYGTQKERKQKRIGWTKPNAFHVCITSYKLVIQDQQSFRRKKWKYLILDEAQNIKNFKSQRWQLLLNFQTERRLLLTGTPLQNNLMELWSLMHFLMPHVFQSHREFKEWFSNPMTGMIEGNSEYNESIIKRLHKVLRPFLLRRLKSEVEKQMPKKYEHVVMCRLSKRQRYLYDDFMNRAKTKETLAGGNLLSVINVLMQLRKVCNHPNLFEVRPTTSPFRMERISFRTASLVCNLLDYDPFMDIDLNSLNLVLIQLEETLTAYVSHRVKKLATPRKLIEEIDALPNPPPKCPPGKYKFHVRIKDTRVQKHLVNHTGVKIGTSPAMKTEGNRLVPVISIDKKYNINASIYENFGMPNVNTSAIIHSTALADSKKNSIIQLASKVRNSGDSTTVNNFLQPTQTTTGTHTRREAHSGTISSFNTHRLNVASNSENREPHFKMVAVTYLSKAGGDHSNSEIQNLVATLAHQLKANSLPSVHVKCSGSDQNLVDSELTFAYREKARKAQQQNRLQSLAKINSRRCDVTPVYGVDFRESMKAFMEPSRKLNYSSWQGRSYTNCMQAMLRRDGWCLENLLKSHEDRIVELVDTVKNYVLFVPPVSAPIPDLHASHLPPSRVNEIWIRENTINNACSTKLRLLHPIISAMTTQFPDRRLIQYDCGKLQTLDKLLRRLKCEGHRVLIFTQMTKMLDVLEAFLNYHGHIYLRLDGTTRIDQRQILMERFNGDKRIFAFILSTRSGGVGVNLTGADTVIFYDSDWNPTMDAQAQDRCHRIGQTRDVHIYRLVSEKTIEENILKKANQKRLLGDLAIEGGNFTTAYFKGSSIQDLFRIENDDDASVRLSEVIDRDRDRKLRLHENQQNASTTTGSDEKATLGIFESALAAAEDEQDVEAATTAKAEVAADLAEFDENIPFEEVDADKAAEVSKADIEFENLIKQLSPIERYAMRFVEETGGAWTAEQLRAAEAEIEQQKREWEANRLAALQKEEESRLLEEKEDEFITYSQEDAKNQVNRKIVNINSRSNKLSRNNRGKGRRIANNQLRSNKRKALTGDEIKSKRRRLLLCKSNATKKSDKRRRIERKTVKVSVRKTKTALRSRNILNDKRISPQSIKDEDDSSMNSIHRSEDFSECSLDVMVDSNDTSNYNARNNDKFSSSSSDENENSNHQSPIMAVVKKELIENHVDVNSPRTRSRGSVKINLWTLDISPILPGVRPMVPKFNRKNENCTSQNSDNDKDISSMHNSACKKSEDDIQDDTVLTTAVNTSKHTEKNPSSMRNSKLLATPKARGKLAKFSKDRVKNNSTLDGWVTTSPLVLLTKSENAECSTPRRSKPKTALRATRRTSLLKINSENGPS